MDTMFLQGSCNRLAAVTLCTRATLAAGLLPVWSQNCLLAACMFSELPQGAPGLTAARLTGGEGSRHALHGQRPQHVAGDIQACQRGPDVDDALQRGTSLLTQVAVPADRTIALSPVVCIPAGMC